MRLEELRETLTRYRDGLKSRGVKSLSVLGPVARGETGPDSDVDLLVEFDRPVDLFEFAELKEGLEDILDAHVHLFAQGSFQPPLRDRVLAEAVRAT